MKTIYTICKEVNDSGFYNSDKCFANLEDAIKYARKIVARDLMHRKRESNKINYLKFYLEGCTSVFPCVINYAYTIGRKTYHFDLRVKPICIFENENEFSKYPIQF